MRWIADALQWCWELFFPPTEGELLLRKENENRRYIAELEERIDALEDYFAELQR